MREQWRNHVSSQYTRIINGSNQTNIITTTAWLNETVSETDSLSCVLLLNNKSAFVIGNIKSEYNNAWFFGRGWSKSLIIIIGSWLPKFLLRFVQELRVLCGWHGPINWLYWTNITFRGSLALLPVIIQVQKSLFYATINSINYISNVHHATVPHNPAEVEHRLCITSRDLSHITSFQSLISLICNKLSCMFEYIQQFNTKKSSCSSGTIECNRLVSDGGWQLISTCFYMFLFRNLLTRLANPTNGKSD